MIGALLALLGLLAVALYLTDGSPPAPPPAVEASC